LLGEEIVSKKRRSRQLSARLDIHVSDSTELDTENWDFVGSNTQYLLHNIHPYPAKFIPQIPKRAIARWSEPGDLVLDPFCGCGTTLLECALAGRNSIGVDNNEVATLVSRAKVAEYNETALVALSELVEDIDKIWKGQIHLEREKWISQAPDYNSRKKWFNDSAVAELSWLRSRVRELMEPALLLGMAVFSSLIVLSSRQDSDTRYAAVERPYSEGTATRLWIIRTRDAIRRARNTTKSRKPSQHKVYNADSRQLPFIDDESINLLVTSPPYLNAYDYHKYHRHRLHWIDANISFARDLEIGKHDTYTRPGAKPEPFFKDLKRCMCEWKRVLRPEARALILIGDAIVNKEFVRVGERLSGLGQELGFELERRWVRNVDTTRKSFNQRARIKREHLLLFKKH